MSADKLAKILEICLLEGIQYTFDKDYYSNDYYDFYQVLDDLILNNGENKIHIVYQELIENKYMDYVEDLDDFEKKNKILEKIKNIEYKKF